MKKKFIKSAEEAEDQFELDESVVDEVSNAEEFADVEITNDDIMDAVSAIEAIADTVIEKADAEEKEIDADVLLDEIRDLIDDTHEEPEEEPSEEEELPEELANSVVRVMVSEDGAVELEQKPDEIYDADVDGLECTVFDTCDDYFPGDDLEETASAEDTEDDVLVIGNSAAKKFRKGYVTIKSSANKKAWSSAYKKVKKMVGSSKLKAVHWVIVSALAKKEEEKDKLKKKIECKLIKAIRSNKEQKAAFFKYIKSDFDEFNPEGAPESETKPEQTAEPANNDYTEEGDPTKATSPEEVDSQSGDPVEDPDKQVEGNTEDVVLPDESITVVPVQLANSVRKIRLQKVRSSKMRKYNLYKVIGSAKDMAVLDGKVVRDGNVAYAFRSGSQGILACCAKYVDAGKGTYKPVIKNNIVVITRGTLAPVFASYERIEKAREIINARREAAKPNRRPVRSSVRKPATRRPVRSSRMTIEERKEALRNRAIASKRNDAGTPTRRPVRSAPVRTPVRSQRELEARKQAIRSRAEMANAQRKEREAIQSKAKLVKMHEAEERQRLFQSSQTKMNEEKIAIKSSNTRNADTLNKMYKEMF